MTSFAQIAVPSPLGQLFTYQIPPDLKASLKKGMRVVVPFRNKERIGFCLGLTGQVPAGFSPDTLKTIRDIKDPFPVFSEKMTDWLIWLSDYYMAPIGEVAKAALPAKLIDVKAKAAANPKIREERHESFHETDLLTLTEKQKSAVKEILRLQTGDQRLQTFLLHGVTGSGKTEVYLQCIAEMLKRGKQAILLVPEIGLTPQLIGRVESRLGQEVAVYHSGLTDAQRLFYWQKMCTASLPVVVGTRSALFAPFPNLGMILVDEEHDTSFKQGEGGVYYHARDAAIVRGKIEGATVVLGSATPSLESFHNAKKGKYHYIRLQERATGAMLPEVDLIDLRKEKFADGSRSLSPALRSAISETLYRGEQTLLLLNRRGFAHFLLCQDCGKTIDCPNCAITLTCHKNPARLVCHYCDFRAVIPERCANCDGTALKPVGHGTESLEEELGAFFPDAVIARLDRDTTEKREYRNRVLHQMRQGKIDILLGTQIVAKGHDFPNVTLVGVILADSSLHMPDFRASERTFQLLTQVAGRSGRADKPGRVLIQTFHPEHASLVCARQHDFESFSVEELKSRQELDYPPFSRLAQIRLQGLSEKKVEATAFALKKYLASQPEILGPAPAPLAKVRGKYRWHFLVKAGTVGRLKSLLKAAQAFAKEHLPPQVQIQIDVDCLHLM